MPTRVLGTKIPGQPTPPVVTPVEPAKPVERPKKLTVPKGSFTLAAPWNPKTNLTLPWANAEPVLPVIQKYMAAFPLIDPYVMLGMYYVESECRQTDKNGKVIYRPDDGYGDGPSIGIGQVKPDVHKRLADSLEADLWTLDGNVEVSMALMNAGVKKWGTWQKALTNDYFPGDDANGTRQNTYVRFVEQFLVLRAGAATAPDVKPVDPPVDQRDLVQVICGNRATDWSYGFKSPTTLPFYDYFNEHGGNAHQHTGIDAMCPLGTTLYAPFDGKVVCTHTGSEAGAWGSSCAAFADEMSGGAGRVEILHADGKRSLVLGHCQASLVKLGSQVKTGQPVAKSGGMNGGAHVHIEAREYVGGAATYMIRDPRQLFRSGPALVVPTLGKYEFLGSPNYMDRHGIVPVALSYHITDDLNLDNVINWLSKPGSNASSHWVIDRDGSKYQLVGSAMASFTNGAVRAPRMDIPWIARHAADWMAGRDNANYYTISFENVGKPGTKFTPEQIDANIELAKYYLWNYPTIQNNRGGHTRHADYDSIERPYCPGNDFPMGTIILACGGDPASLGV